MHNHWLTLSGKRSSIIIAVVIIHPWVLGSPRVALADGSWHQEVSAEQKARATELYEEGNEHYYDVELRLAEQAYRAALSHWDHPGIHFNLSLAQKGQGKTLLAYHSVLAALRHGPQALGPTEYQQAIRNKKELESDLVTLTIECDEPGATVTLNGAFLFVAPGRITQWLAPGEYVAVATKTDFQTRTETMLLYRGQRELRRLTLSAERSGIPWSVMATLGTGVAASALGGYMQWSAVVKSSEFDELLVMECPMGCQERDQSDELKSLRRASATRRTVALISFASAGVALVASGLLFLARDKPRESDRGHDDTDPKATITPFVTRESAGLALRLHL